MRNDRDRFYEVFNIRTGEIVARFDKEHEAEEHAKSLGDMFDFDSRLDDDG